MVNGSADKKEIKEARQKYALAKTNLNKAKDALNSAVDLSKNAQKSIKSQKASAVVISDNNKKINNIGKEIEQKKEEI